jgi:hypothetical protein
MAKKKTNTISAAELGIIRRIAEHYGFSFTDDEGFYEVYGSSGAGLYWNCKHSFEDFLDDLRQYFNKEGEAKSFEDFKSRFKEFLRDED